MNTLQDSQANEYIGAIIRLIAHCTEMHPHFEAKRGQIDIAAAREALNRLCSDYELKLCEVGLATLDRAIADSVRRSRQE